MRHDPIDPARSPDPERPTIVTTDSRVRVLGPRLDALERRSVATIAASEEELEALTRREPGGPDDDAARAHATAVLIDVVARERKELGEIAAARERLVQRTFGVCEGCGDRIPFSRLEALPTARYCLRCQTAAEENAAAVPAGSR